MQKPTLYAMPEGEALEAITETHNGLKVVGSAAAHGLKVLFLEDGTDVVLDATGNVTEWPEA